MKRRKSNRLLIFAPKGKSERGPRCKYNPKYPCKGQSYRRFLCPIEDGHFTGLLDFYFLGGLSEESKGVRDPNAIPGLLSLEISSWFDDSKTLDAYCTWKATEKRRDEDEDRFNKRALRMHPKLCRQFRRAWCRYFVRYGLPGERKPEWMKGWDCWKGQSVEYQRSWGILGNDDQVR